MTHAEGRLLTPRSACGVTLLPDSLTSSVEGHFCPGHLGLVLRTCAARTAVQEGTFFPHKPYWVTVGGMRCTPGSCLGERGTQTLANAPRGCARQSVQADRWPDVTVRAACLNVTYSYFVSWFSLSCPTRGGYRRCCRLQPRRCSGVSGIATVYSCVAVALLVSATACHHLAAPSSGRGRRCPSGARAGTGRGGRG